MRESSNALRLARELGFEDYAALVRFSQEEPERFWPAAIEDMGLEFSQPWDAVVDESNGPEWATWFVGGKLNVAWNCVHRWARGERGGRGGRRSGRARTESGARSATASSRTRSRASPRRWPRSASAPGDRVALFLPMSPEVAIASHACAHLGAIQVPIFSGFAAPAIAARLQHAEAKVVVTADGSLRRGREVPMKALVDEALADSPSVEHVVVWRRLGRRRAHAGGARRLLGRGGRRLPGRARAARGRLRAPVPPDLHLGHDRAAEGRRCTSTAASSSRSRARSPTRRMREPGDVIHFVTDMGWIMGPWEVVGGMALGCTIVFAEGAPDWPQPTGSGGWSRASGSRSSASRPRSCAR